MADVILEKLGGNPSAVAVEDELLGRSLEKMLTCVCIRTEFRKSLPGLREFKQGIPL